MVTHNPRNIEFKYAAENHRKEPIRLDFSFREDAEYQENLKLFLALLEQAREDVSFEVEKVALETPIQKHEPKIR